MRKEGRSERETERRNALGVVSSLCLSFALFLLLSFTLSLFSSFINNVSAHKYHFSFTQIEYNAKEKTAEITLRVFADDLENAISKHSGKPIKLDHKEAANLVAAYVRESLDLKGRDGHSKKLTWIGMESKVDVSLLYLEAKAPEGLSGTRLRQRILLDLFDDQVNQVLCKTDTHKTSLEFKSGDGFKTISFAGKE